MSARELAQVLADGFRRRLTPAQKRTVARFVRASRRDPTHVLRLSRRERGKLLRALRGGLGL